VLPVLILLVTGLLQFGVLLSGQIALVNGVREAARYGSVLTTRTQADAAANSAAIRSHLAEVLREGLPGFSADNLTATTVCYMSYRNPESSPPTYSVRLDVSATYRHPLFIPIISNLIDLVDGSGDGHLRLSASEEFRVENVPLSNGDTDIPGSEVCMP
jgi:Flp pilus assembly protein TadG